MGDTHTALARAVDVGDVAVRFEASDEGRARAVASLLLEVPMSTSTPAAVVRYQHDAPTVPSRQPDHVVDGVEVWLDGDAMHVRVPSGSTGRATEAGACVGGGGDDPRSFRSLLLPMLTHVLAFRDRFVLHAGAVATGGGAYVVLGTTGAGKSTLGLAALEAGWQLLADDMVVLRQASTGDSVEIAGIQRTAAVPGDLVSSVRTQVLGDDVRGRRRLPPGHLQAGWFPASGVIAVGHGNSAEGSLTTVGGHDSLRAVLNAFTSSLNPSLLRRFLRTAAALSRLPAWNLHHGAEASTRLAVAAELLSSIAGNG